MSDSEDPFEVSGLAGDSAFDDSTSVMSAVSQVHTVPLKQPKPQDTSGFGERFFFIFFFFFYFFFFLETIPSFALLMPRVLLIVPSAERAMLQIIVSGSGLDFFFFFPFFVVFFIFFVLL